ncbi:IS3 family transposase [Ornithinimicrobium panacihumi]|uniref:IS3 family transposase n=1 Tax=Ornithinimicrobium panacihumi TaxID=2008449 RepID=UPI003F88EBB6
MDEHKAEHGVEPICAALKTTTAQIAPSTYYASKKRPASARALRDLALITVIARIHAANYGVYGARKVWHALKREGHDEVARCTVERLMRVNGLRGVSKEKAPRTTRPARDDIPDDFVNRQFVASAPNELWVADITYIKTHSGWVYASFVMDMFSRFIVGWQVATSLHTRLALDALDMAIWARTRAGDDLSSLIHHSDRGVQYRAVRYTERLAEAGAVASVGSKGDCLLTGQSPLQGRSGGGQPRSRGARFARCGGVGMRHGHRRRCCQSSPGRAALGADLSCPARARRRSQRLPGVPD